MIKAARAVALTAALALPASAAPATQDECLKSTLALAEKAEAKSDLPDDAVTRVEDLLSKMEAHCDAGRFSEAATVSAELEQALAGK